MPRRIFPASTVTNTTGAALSLIFHATSTTGRRETDLWTVDGSNNLVERIPNGVVSAAAVTGAYSAFAGPDDMDTLYVGTYGGTRAAISATDTVAGGTALDATTFAKRTNNLSDLSSASTARTNLGLGTAPTAGQRQIMIYALGTPKSVVGTWAYQINGAAYLCGYATNSGTSAQNDAITFYETWLDAGTWQLDLMAHSGTDGGQAAAALVGASTLDFSGTSELYAASAAAVRTNFSGISVATAGLYSVKFTAPSKNASSSAYRMRIAGAVLTRTA